MIYEGIKVIGISKPLAEYKKNYIVCVKSSEFWVVYDEFNSYKKAKDTVNNLEYNDCECIIIWKKRGELK